MRDDSVYLEHVAESIERVARYLRGAGGTPDQRLFYDDPEKQDAVLRRMETLADAAAHLSEELRARYPNIDWRKIANFRNVLAHGYIDVHLDEVWEAIVDDLPALKAVIDQELSHAGEP